MFSMSPLFPDVMLAITCLWRYFQCWPFFVCFWPLLFNVVFVSSVFGLRCSMLSLFCLFLTCVVQCRLLSVLASVIHCRLYFFVLASVVQCCLYFVFFGLSCSMSSLFVCFGLCCSMSSVLSILGSVVSMLSLFCMFLQSLVQCRLCFIRFWLLLFITVDVYS